MYRFLLIQVLFFSSLIYANSDSLLVTNIKFESNEQKRIYYTKNILDKSSGIEVVTNMEISFLIKDKNENGFILWYTLEKINITTPSTIEEIKELVEKANSSFKNYIIHTEKLSFDNSGKFNDYINWNEVKNILNKSTSISKEKNLKDILEIVSPIFELNQKIFYLNKENIEYNYLQDGKLKDSLCFKINSEVNNTSDNMYKINRTLSSCSKINNDILNNLSIENNYEIYRFYEILSGTKTNQEYLYNSSTSWFEMIQTKFINDQTETTTTYIIK